MHRFLTAALGGLGGLAVMAGLVVLGLAPHTQAGAQPSVSVGSATILVNNQGSVDLSALDMPAPGLGAWSVYVTYDPNIVNVSDCNEAAVGVNVCNPAYDEDSVAVAGASAGGLEGDTLLASITFQCKVIGTSPLAIEVGSLADATLGTPAAIDAAVFEGNISCVGAEPTATAVPPQPTATPTQVPSASGGACAQYVYQEFAQFVLNLDPTDPHGLDPDHDGIACEDLPPRPIVCGGTYEGEIAGGGTIRVVVSPDCNGISSISIFNFHTPCTDINQQNAVDPPAPISDPYPDGSMFFSHAFLAGPNQAPITVALIGKFLPNGTIEGYIDISSDSDPQCEQDTRAFVAVHVQNTGGPPPAPTAVPAGGSSQVAGATSAGGSSSLPSAGYGPALQDTSPQAWLIAGLAGAGIAWFVTGLAGAGMATVNGARRQRVAAPVAPSMPKAKRTATANDVFETPRFVPTSRPSSSKWTANARDDLANVDSSSMPDIGWWKIRRHRGR